MDEITQLTSVITMKEQIEPRINLNLAIIIIAIIINLIIIIIIIMKSIIIMKK